jgi:tetratricopeptide (TPR) repeat protein
METNMLTKQSHSGWALAALALLLAAGLAGAAPVDEEAALKKQILQLNEITGADPAIGKVLELLDDQPGAKKLVAVAHKMAKQKDQPLNVNATYILARLAQALKDVDASETFYRLNVEQAKKLESGQKLASAFAGLIQLYTDAKKYAEAEKVCKEFLDLDVDENVDRLKPGVQRRMILILARQGDVDKAIEMVDKLIKAQPQNWLNLETKARVFREAGKPDDAAKLYLEIIDKIGKDNRLEKDAKEDFISEMRYTLSGVYVDLKQIDKAEEQLRALLSKEPDNPTFNNDLGYILADHDMKLEESEKLVRKALDEDRKQRRKANPDLKPEEDKDNPAYLDSMGWVLFKQKKYPEAKKFLQQALEQEDGRHLEIYEHMGDTHMALGEKKDAVSAYKKALEVASDSKRDKARKSEIEKKIISAEK